MLPRAIQRKERFIFVLKKNIYVEGMRNASEKKLRKRVMKDKKWERKITL